MSTFLTKVGSTYYFRRVVPDDVKACFLTASGRERTEFKLSLGTKERREGERLGRLMAVKVDRDIDEARARLSAKAAPQASASTEAMSIDEIEAMEFANEQNFIQDQEQAAREGLRRGALKLVMAPDTSPEFRAIRDMLDESYLRSPEEQAARDRKIAFGWVEGEREFAKSWKAGAANEARASYPRLMDLFDGYLVEAMPQPATVKRWRPLIAHFIRFLGHDDASRVTVEDVVRWKQELLAETAGGKPVRGAKTVRESYLAALSVTFAWGVENARVPTNPVKGVTVRSPKAEKLRERDFTKDEVLTILRATQGPLSENLTPEHALARRWVPWVCAYTGARVSEITQLRAQDVAKIDGTWSILITPEAGGQKSQTARTVPMHEHLVEMGFGDLAASKGEGPLFYDPLRGRGGSDANPQYKKVGERLGAWVRRIGVNDPAVQPNHGWRHLFISIARDVGMDPEAREAIPGHAPSTEGRKYGRRSLAFLAKEMEKFPRFVI
jgi:integrase